jgi:ABC-type Fe3+ transport system permease subunit
LGWLRVVLACAVAWALVPGVLVGAAVAQFMRLPIIPEVIEQSAVPMVIAHLSRASFLPILVGIWLGSSEAGGLADTRLLDGATGLRNWVRTSLRSAIGPALAVGLACGCLSFHEIESSVQVQPPGIDHIAQRLLQWLHYERMAELSAAGVFLLGLGIVASVLVVLGAVLGRPRTQSGPRR